MLCVTLLGATILIRGSTVQYCGCIMTMTFFFRTSHMELLARKI